MPTPENDPAAPQPPQSAAASGLPGEPLVPALRQVKAEAVNLKAGEAKGQEDEMVIVLQDPEHLAPQPAVLSPAAYALVQLFDGNRTAQEIADLFEQMYGQEVKTDQVLSLQRELDAALYLSSPHFDKTVREALTGYLKAKVRPASHAGTGYPEDPDELKKFVESFFGAKDAPGALPAGTLPPASSDRVKALMLPHIDFNAGMAAYAHGYKALLEASQADLFVILGVAHQAMSEAPFLVSKKDLSTPLRQVATERALAGRLQKAAGVEESLAEFAHKSEHSIEYQAVLLAALLGERAKRDFEVLPILCGSVEGFIESDASPLNDDAFKRFVEALGEELERSKRRVCVLASVDLSHIGPKFGHSTSIDEKLLKPVARADRQMLASIEKLDPAAFFFEIARTQNSRNVDAVMAMLALLSLGKDIFKQASLLHYDQFLEQPTKSAVTFASMSFE
ncbi:MAG: AmmeMemoRadiSam system protein B [Planctomycetota bacterium]|nr:AmmeMemoRadiSam system protein B [Planctomycetota bacterium]